MRRLALFALLGFLGCQKEMVTKATAEKSVAESPTAEVAVLAQGADVPPITGVAHDGSQVDFKSYAGKPFVVYFYAKDDTPG